jgi:hypothetical protein
MQRFLAVVVLGDDVTINIPLPSHLIMSSKRGQPWLTHRVGKHRVPRSYTQKHGEIWPKNNASQSVTFLLHVYGKKISLELSVTSRMEACASLLHSMSEKGQSVVEMHAWLLESPWHGTSAL